LGRRIVPEYLSPGVYVQETEAGGKPIAGVGTATPGFIGMTQHIAAGEFDNDSLLNRPVLVTGWDQFVRSYGRYEHKTAPYLAPAVHGFFANGGSRCYVETLEGSELRIIQEFIPPSGHVAGIYARTDTERGVHKAPANEPVNRKR
jgi:hypothetical protein